MTRNSFVSGTACACMAMAGLALPLNAQLKPEDLYAAVSPSIVTLEVENVGGRHFIGGAFLAVDDCLAVTAWHVVHDARRVEARFSDNHSVKVIGLVDKNEQLDLALIKLEASGRPRLKLGSATPRIGARVYVVGAPSGFDLSISEGLISQIRTVDNVRYYQVSCPISPGDSGGPVFNDQGEAIGVVSWRKADAENLGFAIPSTAVARMNAALPVVAWLDRVPLSRPRDNQLDRPPVVRAKIADTGRTVPDSYTNFLQFLSARRGEQVTVTVQEQRGKESRFSFEVPKPQAQQ